MTQTDDIGTPDDNSPNSSSLSSHSQQNALIKQSLEFSCVILSLFIALFLTSKLLATLPVLLANTLGAMCFILAASFSRVLIALTLGGSPFQVVLENISGAISGAFEAIAQMCGPFSH